MSKQFQIKSLSNIDWDAHYDYENHIDFKEHISNGEIEIGDFVTVEHKDECYLPLHDDEYCISFKKDFDDKDFDDNVIFFMEEPFKLSECKLLFGNDFDYGVTKMNQDYEQTWEEFWKDICTNEDGTPNLDQIKMELFDYKKLLHNVSIVYDHVTGGRLSKAFTDPQVIKDEADDHYATIHICPGPHY